MAGGRKLLILNERDLAHPWAGGAEVHIMEIARRAVAAGYRPTLLCTRVRGAAAETVQDGVRIRRAGNRFSYYAMLPLLVRREIAEPGTVIIEHLNKIPFCTPLYARVPMIAVAHHLFGWTAFQQVSFPVAAAVVASERLIPPLYHGPIVAVSPSTRADLIARGVAADQIGIIPNGVDHARYVPAERPVNTPTLLVVARIEPYKRIDLILRALQTLIPRIPEIRLLVVGAGSALEPLRQQAAQLRIAEHVTFTGFVDEPTKVRWMQQAALVVNASEKEGWGLTVLEANACGVPAVASDVPGLRDAVVPGETGVLVPHGDVVQLSEAIRRLLTADDERHRLAVGARTWSLRFSWDESTRELLALIEATCAGARWRALLPTLGPWASPTVAPTAPAAPDALTRRAIA